MDRSISRDSKAATASCFLELYAIENLDTVNMSEIKDELYVASGLSITGPE